MAARRSGHRPAAEREPPGPEASLEIAARYLATRPRSRWEVERRLQRAGAATDVVASTLARLETLGFVDDLAFGRWWLDQRDRHAPRSRRMVEAELRQHGVARDVIAELHEELRPADGPALPATDDERAAAALVAHLRGRAVPAGDRRAMQRLGMYLVRRGFSPETARATLRAAAAGTSSEPEADD
jgi:regulatory protein